MNPHHQQHHPPHHHLHPQYHPNHHSSNNGNPQNYQYGHHRSSAHIPLPANYQPPVVGAVAPHPHHHHLQHQQPQQQQHQFSRKRSMSGDSQEDQTWHSFKRLRLQTSDESSYHTASSGESNDSVYNTKNNSNITLGRGGRQQYSHQQQQHPGQATGSSESFQNRPSPHHLHRDASTSSAGLPLPPSTVVTATVPSSASSEEEDYTRVNHFLGLLHQQRRQRMQMEGQQQHQQHQQHQQQAGSVSTAAAEWQQEQYSCHPHHPMAPNNNNNGLGGAVGSGQFLLPKQQRRHAVRLPSSSNLM